MKHERSTGETQETAALYALGSLNQHDARAFENHLEEGCAICSLELQRFEKVVDSLGLTASEVEPPSYLRELLVAHLEHGFPEGAGSVVGESGQTPPAQTAPRPRRAMSVWLRAISWATALGFAVLAACFYYWWKQSEQLAQVRKTELVAARGDADQLTRMLQLERGRARELEDISSVLERPGARVLLLAGPEPSSSASAAIFWDVPRKRWLVTGRLPQAGSGKAYQLWYVTAAGRVSAGMLQQDEQGHVFSVLDGPDAIAEIKEAVITLEPAGGSAQPTWPIIAVNRR